MDLQSDAMILQGKEMIKMTGVENGKRLNEIVVGASKLSIENQEYILATIKAMLFTRSYLLKRTNHSYKPQTEHLA